MEDDPMENKNNTLKTLLIVVGAIVCVGTAAVLVYTFLKKHFKVTFACDGCDDCDCECCEGFEDELEDCEPICCCEEEEPCTSDAEEAAE